MDRRSFLRGAAMVGSSVLTGGIVAACGTNGHSSATHGSGTATSTRSDGGPPDWDALASALNGTVLRPGDDGYVVAGHLYNSLYPVQAAAIAQCQSPSDVQRCLAFCRAHEVPLAVRSAGHSYAAYSSGPGLVIDVAPMDTVDVGTDGTASVGAGAQLIDVYSQLGTHGVMIPGGSCPTVGIGGLALGGGIGVFGRAYGMTCDSLVGVDIVTADGTRRHCSAEDHEDLYWASRGGGGGTFGVVTTFEFRSHPIPDAITLFTLEWPWGAAETVLDAWLRWIPGAPDALWANCQLYSSGATGSGLVKVTGVFGGTVSACEAALAPLAAAIDQSTTYRFVGPEDYLTAMMIEAGCEGKPVAQCDAPVESPFAAKSTFIGAALPEPSVRALVSAVSDFPATLAGSGAGAGVVFDGYGGAINRVAQADTAFVHRDAVACAQYSVTYPTTSPSPSTTATARAWLAQIERALTPVAQGAYQNYIDPTLADWQTAYYGTNLPRLRQIKGKYDPHDVFRFAQSIRPA
jgi:FAD/FMN-containing dehydrogenase